MIINSEKNVALLNAVKLVYIGNVPTYNVYYNNILMVRKKKLK